MEKNFNSQYEEVSLHNVESFVLDKLSVSHTMADNRSINIRELMDSINDEMSPLFDQAIEDLVSQSMINCEDGENYRITFDGVNELERRKKESIPL